METQILNEIKQIRNLLTKMLGTSEKPARQQFSDDALDKAAVEFKNLSIKRGEWVKECDISKIVRSAPYNSAKFIIEKFRFNNYFKRGHSYYFNRKELIAFNNELKIRSIHLGRYMELLEDQEKFNSYVEDTKDIKGLKKRKRFYIPDGLKNIETVPYGPPSKDIINQHIATLKEEFQMENLAEYIDIYHDSHAMFKYLYYFDHYLKPELKKRCRKWCDEFNYANNALERVIKFQSEIVK
jgi:hypothetical protein